MPHITAEEVLMERQVEFPLTSELLANLETLLAAVNQLRNIYGIPMIVSSGYRPGHYNKDAGGASKSAHLTCEAVDFHDQDRKLTNYCLGHLDLLEQCGLYMESPTSATTWLHVQTRMPKSGNRVFRP